MIRRYNPVQVGVVVGVSLINGLAEDSMITIDTEEEAPYTLSQDISGQVTRFKSNKSDAKITLILTQSSPSNNVLSAYVELDRVSNSGVFPLMIQDGSGTLLFTSPSVFVEQTPEFGNKNKNCEWTLRTTNISKFVVGIE
jgi:hypothetical protein